MSLLSHSYTALSGGLNPPDARRLFSQALCLIQICGIMELLVLTE